ncbi:flagellar basal body rod protein FlgC [Aquabacterium sp.]|uniref:flagellar basal body rod protein FlgC n=1 Tax=Aquabacterium sp. TaxID=1872578 RepID=UPI002BA2D33F|nr:flagellar basal body rod C-terminal domain-containing protein [Aquabacterium sp.]HSW06358.1 flagellar basal body rod C-terminal domain-containing protein [Aquabacterium sp.]
MDYRAILEIGASGMTLEKKRLEAAALNLANMHNSIAPGSAGYRPLRVVAEAVPSTFAGLVQAGSPQHLQLALVPSELAPRAVRDPGHPHADENGFVHYPAVDHALEMVTAMTAMRAYEANVAALGLAKAMASRALEIGSQR